MSQAFGADTQKRQTPREIFSLRGPGGGDHPKSCNSFSPLRAPAMTRAVHVEITHMLLPTLCFPEVLCLIFVHLSVRMALHIQPDCDLVVKGSWPSVLLPSVWEHLDGRLWVRYPTGHPLLIHADWAGLVRTLWESLPTLPYCFLCHLLHNELVYRPRHLRSEARKADYEYISSDLNSCSHRPPGPPSLGNPITSNIRSPKMRHFHLTPKLAALVSYF